MKEVRNRGHALKRYRALSDLKTKITFVKPGAGGSGL
jgi:hypothetical protein